MLKQILLCLIITLGAASLGYTQSYSNYHQQFIDEHIYRGFPGFDNIYIRQAYVLSYNHEHRIANWVAYHVVPDYLITVPRHGRFAALRTDYQIPDPVRAHETEGWDERGEGYARRHLAPFSISGGDRDGDLLYGVEDINGDGVVNTEDMRGREMAEYVTDADELSRVYEINYMSNIVPQHSKGFSGPGGIWTKLERYIQEDIVRDQEEEVWVVAGPVLGRGAMEKAGPDSDITVPPMFFKVVVREELDGSPVVLAFLVPHHKEVRGRPQDYLVSVDLIEALTGLDFFRELDDEEEARLERQDTWLNRHSF